MPVMRKDLILKVGLYELPRRDGLWKIYKAFDTPTIQMISIESGELFDMRMSSMDNIRSVLIREIEEGEEIATPYEVFERVIKERVEVPVKAPEPEPDERAASVIDELRLMILDASVMIGEVLAVDRPKKAQKEQMQAWFDQVEELGEEWGLEVPENLQDDFEGEEQDESEKEQ